MSPTSSFLGKAFLAIFYHIIFFLLFIHWIIKPDFHLLFKNILTITAMLLRKITLLAVFIFYNEEKKKRSIYAIDKKMVSKTFNYFCCNSDSLPTGMCLNILHCFDVLLAETNTEAGGKTSLNLNLSSF